VRSPQQPAAAHSVTDYRAVVDRYCVTCHNERTKTGGLTLDEIDLSNVPAGADVWEKVVRKVRVGMMPPQGAPRPDQDTAHALVSFLTTELDRAWLSKPNPGRGLIHRLNRVEYANVRDLFSLDVDTSSMPPAMPPAADNIADAGMSPVLPNAT
jgi:cytochrome c5